MNIIDGVDEYHRGQCKLINNETYVEYYDEYEHIDNTIEYLLENIIFQTRDDNTIKKQNKNYNTLKDLFNSKFCIGCNCSTNKNNNNINNCGTNVCLHGGNYITYINAENKKQLILNNKNRNGNDLIYECSTDLCKCKPNICQNRLLQFGPCKYLKIINVTYNLKKQCGLIATKEIPKGGFICEYIGEILTKEEAVKRHMFNKLHDKMNYIICLNEYSTLSNITEHKTTTEPEQQHIQTFIDPTYKGNIGRYLNHSCDSNCEIFSIRTDGPLPKLGINLYNYKNILFNYTLIIEISFYLLFFFYNKYNLFRYFC